MDPGDKEQEILADILAEGNRQEKAIKRLYEDLFHLLKAGKAKYPALEEDELLSAYNASIIAFRRQVLQGSFRRESSIPTYVRRIFFNKCIDMLRKRSSMKVEQLDNLPDVHDQNRQNSLQQLIIDDDFSHLLKLLDTLGTICKQIILDSEYWGYSSEEIARRISFANAKSVNSKKYTCLRQLRKLMKAEKEE
jgi:RNA polymerase sigma-70 factor (ECF subfamily)